MHIKLIVYGHQYCADTLYLDTTYTRMALSTSGATSWMAIRSSSRSCGCLLGAIFPCRRSSSGWGRAGRAEAKRRADQVGAGRGQVVAVHIPAITTTQMMDVDRLMVDSYHIALSQMMENAGRDLAEMARRTLHGQAREHPITILCGPGNNGGGGMVAARHLHNWGARVNVVLAAESAGLREVSGAAMVHFGGAASRSDPVELDPRHPFWMRCLATAPRAIPAPQSANGSNMPMPPALPAYLWIHRPDWIRQPEEQANPASGPRPR